MPKVDVTALKLAGLPVDLDRLAREGDEWLGPEHRLALKKHGICGQGQPGVFMVRIRTSGGTMSSATTRALAEVARRRGRAWVHLTTRQQVELHHVAARDVPSVMQEVEDAGLTTSSTCGHTLRGVMSCSAAGAGLDEPFDCYPDARAISDSVMARTPELNCQLPQRINILLGGCPSCREHARTNEIGFISTIRGGTPGYEMWVGGSLGKSQPTLGWKLRDFVERGQVLAGVHALIDLFIAHGDFDRPHRARLKHLVAELGREDLVSLFNATFARRTSESWPTPPPVSVTEPDQVARILGHAPAGGWSSGVRPQRTAGRAMVTVTVPLGDLDSDDLQALADAADELSDGTLRLTRSQNILLQDVAVADVPRLREALAAVSLSTFGADQSTDARACTGGPICNLAITPTAAVGAALRTSPAVVRNARLRLHVSGCPNGCAQHQIGDLGYSGTKVTIDGLRTLGYQIWAGADVPNDRLSEVVGRVAATDVVAITEAIIGIWEALRSSGESLSHTVHRIGIDGIQAQIGAVFDGRWEPGPEPDPAVPETELAAARLTDYSLPMVAAS